MKAPEPSLSIAQPHPEGVDALRKTGFAVAIAAVVYLLLAWAKLVPVNATALIITLSGIVAGTVVYAWQLYRNVPPGIKNNGVFTSSLTNAGLWGWAAGIVLTGFYVPSKMCVRSRQHSVLHLHTFGIRCRRTWPS